MQQRIKFTFLKHLIPTYSKKPNLIIDLTRQFSLDMILYCDKLYQEKKFVIAQQLLKSATSIGANIMEAQHAESAADFLHKLKIASKEANETEYWLDLCANSPGFLFDDKYQKSIQEILKVLSKIIVTIKKRI